MVGAMPAAHSAGLQLVGVEMEAGATKNHNHGKGGAERFSRLPGADDRLHFTLLTMHVKRLRPVFGVVVDDDGFLDPDPLTRLHGHCPLN